MEVIGTMTFERTYQVGLSPDEITRRLALGVDVDHGLWFSHPGRKPHCGHVGRDRFEVTACDGPGGSFQPVLFGRVESVPGGSRIEVRTGIQPFAPTFLLFWLCAMLFFQVVAAGAWALSSDIPTDALLAPSAMALFGLALYRVQRWLGRGRERRLIGLADQLWAPGAPAEEPRA